MSWLVFSILMSSYLWMDLYDVVFSSYCIFYVFFFFSSRRRHTRCSRDWSSDVCSSDLAAAEPGQREYAKLRPQLPRFCGCDTCRGDVLVFALNRLAASYVSTPQGEVLVELRLDSDQEKAKLDVALLEGFRKVGLAPRCGAKPVQLM